MSVESPRKIVIDPGSKSGLLAANQKHKGREDRSMIMKGGSEGGRCIPAIRPPVRLLQRQSITPIYPISSSCLNIDDEVTR